MSDSKGIKKTGDKIVDESTYHLNKILDEGLVDDGEVVVLDETLHEVVSLHEKKQTLDTFEKSTPAIPEDADVSSEVRKESQVLETAVRYRARLLYYTMDI